MTYNVLNAILFLFYIAIVADDYIQYVLNISISNLYHITQKIQFFQQKSKKNSFSNQKYTRVVWRVISERN